MKPAKTRDGRLPLFLPVLLILLLLLPVVFILAQYLSVLLHAQWAVRVSFTGLENLFHAPCEYWAVSDTRMVRIPACFVGLLGGEDAVDGFVIDDSDGACWYTELVYADCLENLPTDEGWTDSHLGPNWRITWNRWTSGTPAPADPDVTFLRQTAETLYETHPEDWVWQGRGAEGKVSFLTLRHGDLTLVVENDRRLLLPLPDGTLRHLGDCPEKGHFDYWIPLADSSRT